MNSSSPRFRPSMGSKSKLCAGLLALILCPQYLPVQGGLMGESVSVGGNMSPLAPPTGQIETINGKVPRKMSEGGLIKSLFNLGFSTLNYYAQEAKVVEELERNGMDPQSLLQNTTTVNNTVGEDDGDRRHFQRHSYDAEGNHKPSNPIIPKKNGRGGGGLEGFGRFRGGAVLGNLSSAAKRMTGVDGFGKGFNYVGNGRHDYGLKTTTGSPIWSYTGADTDEYGDPIKYPFSSYPYGSLFSKGRFYGMRNGMGYGYGRSWGGGYTLGGKFVGMHREGWVTKGVE